MHTTAHICKMASSPRLVLKSISGVILGMFNEIYINKGEMVRLNGFYIGNLWENLKAP